MVYLLLILHPFPSLFCFTLVWLHFTTLLSCQVQIIKLSTPHHQHCSFMKSTSSYRLHECFSIGLQKKPILWILSSIWMKILNDIAFNLNWIWNWIQLDYNLIAWNLMSTIGLKFLNSSSTREKWMWIGGEGIENMLMNMVLDFILF
jgi:hypothetical protein